MSPSDKKVKYENFTEDESWKPEEIANRKKERRHKDLSLLRWVWIVFFAILAILAVFIYKNSW